MCISGNMIIQIIFVSIFSLLIIENNIFNNKYEYSGISQNGFKLKNIVNIYAENKEGIMCLNFILEMFFTSTEGL